LLERRGVLGGRSCSSRDAVTGDAVDNGMHVMIGAYHTTLDLLRRAGASDLLEVQDNLRLDYVDERGFSSLSCPPVVAPWHLALGLAGLRLPWRTRWDALRFGLSARFRKRPAGRTLADHLKRLRQSPATRRLLWDPLATAILNAAPETADAGLFVDVFRIAFLRKAQDSALVFLRAGFDDLLERLGAYFEGRGGVIERGTRALGLCVDGGRVSGVSVVARPKTREQIVGGVRSHQETLAADAVVLAVPWTAVGALVPEPWRSGAPFPDLERLGRSPIVSVDLWLDREVLDRPMVGLRDEEMEWVFDKGRLHGRSGPPQHLSFIASAAERGLERTNAEVVASATRALGRYFPAMQGATVVRALVRREPEATFMCAPGTERLRPGPETPLPGLYLAGDWTATGLPATIEGAVRSGLAAAAAVERGGGVHV